MRAHTHTPTHFEKYFSATLFSKTFCKARMKQLWCYSTMCHFNLFLCFVKFFKDFVDCFWTVCCKRGNFVHKKNKTNSFCKDLAAFFLNIDLRRSIGTCWKQQPSCFDRFTEKCTVWKSVINALTVSSKFVSSETRLNSETKTSYPLTKSPFFLPKCCFIL